MRIRPDGFVSHTVTDVPANWVFDGAALRPRVRELVRQGVVRVIAGPTHVHITIRLQRPYYRPETQQQLMLGTALGEAGHV